MLDNLGHPGDEDRHRRRAGYKPRGVRTPARIDPRFGPSGLAFEAWLSPLVAAVVAGATLAAAPADVEQLRGWVFVIGPLLWLAGLAPRLSAYLHDGQRLRLLPLPLPGTAHWAAAARPHRQGLMLTAVLGFAAIALACGPALGTAATLGLLVDFLWLGMLVALLEPWTAAISALLGRRFESGGARAMQARLSGGFTLPEATAHLYVPPLVLGLATLLAMPGQLLADRFVDGAAIPAALWAIALGAAGLAVLARPLAHRPYAVAVFEAVPWLAQATRTLAGPPVPIAVPRIIARTRDPALRLFLFQLWRTTPVPGLRLGALLGIAGWIGLVAGLTAPRAALVVALATAWIVPGLRVLVRGAASRAAALSGRPGASAVHSGRPAGAWAWLLGPALLAAGLCLLGRGGAG